MYIAKKSKEKNSPVMWEKRDTQKWEGERSKTQMNSRWEKYSKGGYQERERVINNEVHYIRKKDREEDKRLRVKDNLHQKDIINLKNIIVLSSG